MTKEQKELLYEITCLHSRQFYLAMKDTWSDQDFITDNEYTREIKRLENEYKEIYGDLPDWGNSIEKVWAIKAELKNELEKEI